MTERAPQARQRLARSLFAVSILLIAGATLLPGEPDTPIEWWTVLCVLCGRAALADALANLLLFAPLGAALALMGWRPGRLVLLAGGLSLSIELTQFAIPGRDPSLSDVIFNTLGAVVGAALALLAPAWSRPSVRAAGRLDLMAAVGAAGAFVLTAFLLGLALPETAYFGGSALVQSTDQPLRIGGNLEPHGYFRGRIDEVRIYRRARMEAEIRADMAAPLTAGSPDLVAAYSFDEGVGSVATDASGHGHSAQIKGAAWTDGGRFGKALEFDGTGSIVTVPHATALDLTDAMTLEAWIYPEAAQDGWRAVLQKDFDAYFLLAGSRAGALKPGGGATFGASTEPMTSPTRIATEQWTHVAVTYDSALLRLYIDGREVQSRLRWYPGRVLDTTVGGIEVPGGLVERWQLVRERLLAGGPLRVRAIGASGVSAQMPLATLHDAQRDEIALLAVEDDDVVFRLRTRGAAAGLDTPTVRVPGLMRGVVPGQPFTVSVWRASKRYCASVDARLRCGLGFTLGAGWTLLGFSQVPLSWHAMLDHGWVAGLLMPFGFWLRRRWECALGGGLIGSALALASLIGGLEIRASEIAAALGGVVLGRLFGWWCARSAWARPTAEVPR